MMAQRTIRLGKECRSKGNDGYEDPIESIKRARLECIGERRHEWNDDLDGDAYNAADQQQHVGTAQKHRVGEAAVGVGAHHLADHKRGDQ